MDRNSLRQQVISSPFPVSPKGKPGRGRFPPRREHAARQQKRLARIDAAGSPHNRGCRPLVDPLRARWRRAWTGPNNRMFHKRKSAENGRRGRIVSTENSTLRLLTKENKEKPPTAS